MSSSETEQLQRDLNTYSDTVNRLEPDIHPIDVTAAAASIAISLKRIADSLETIALCVDTQTLRIRTE